MKFGQLAFVGVMEKVLSWATRATSGGFGVNMWARRRSPMAKERAEAKVDEDGEVCNTYVRTELYYSL